MRLMGRLLLLMDDLLRVLGRRREDEVMLVLGPRLEDISSAVSIVLSDLEDLLVLLPTMDDDDDDDALNEDHLLLSVLSAVDCSRGMYIRRDAWLLYLSSNCKGSIVLR